MPDYEQLRLDHQLCFALYAAMHAVTRQYRGGLADLGLTYPQYLVLLALWEGGDQPLGALARRLDLDGPTLTPILKRLADAGWVLRRRDADDERVVRISLTPRASGLRQRLAELQSRVVCATGLSPIEFAALREMLHRLTETMTAGRQGSAAPRASAASSRERLRRPTAPPPGRRSASRHKKHASSTGEE